MGLVLITVVAVTLIINNIEREPPPHRVPLQILSHYQQTIKIIIEMDKLLISLATLIIGVGGAFLVKKFDIEIHQDFPQRALFVLMYYSAALSIYCGYVLYDNMVEMLGNKSFDANHSYLIQLPQNCQFYIFLFSLFCFSIFVIRGVNHQKNESNKTS
jgi:uncharacterized membrane protein YozB (DUF420 family)